MLKKIFERFTDDDREWLQFIVGFVVIFIVAKVTAEVYRRFQLLLVCLWLSIPALAYIIGTRKLDAHLTERGFKSLRIWLMIFAVGMSFIVFLDYDLKARFGHYVFKGSEFWLAGVGHPDGVSQEYFAPTAWGRFVLGAYDWILLGFYILLPYILYWSFHRSSREETRFKKKSEST